MSKDVVRHRFLIITYKCKVKIKDNMIKSFIKRVSHDSKSHKKCQTEVFSLCNVHASGLGIFLISTSFLQV